ncbi:MAG: ATP synthase F0 subunit B [Oligoflexus sp.]
MEGFNWITGFLFPYLNLLLFLFLLVKVLKGPLTGAVNKRHEQYLQTLQEANTAKEEAEKEQRELQAKLAGLEAEIAEIQERAKRHAESEAAKIVAHAESLAANLQQEAQRIAASELEEARDSLRQEILQEVRQNIVNRVHSDLGQAQQVDLIHKQLNHLPSQLVAVEGLR